MAKTPFVIKSKKKMKLINYRGIQNNFALAIESKPKMDDRDTPPSKRLVKKLSKTNSFRVDGGNALLTYDLQFHYVIWKYDYSAEGPIWQPQANASSCKAVKYTGPKTHYLDIEIIFQKVTSIGPTKSNPRLHFQLKQWYGPLIKFSDTAATVITNGHVDMVGGKLVIAKTKW